MKRGLDSRPPTDAQIAAANAAGYEVWAGYLGDPGDGIDPGHLWPKERFDAVRAAGMGTFAYVSGAQDPARIAARAAAYGIRIFVDVERFIRSDGPWLDEGWLATSGAGLYGNGSVHYNAAGFRRAAGHVFAGYYGYDPRATWPSWLIHDGSPLGWQFQGTTELFGLPVDLSWFDDSLAGTFGTAGQSLSGGFGSMDDQAILDQFNAVSVKASAIGAALQAQGNVIIGLIKGLPAAGASADLSAELAALATANGKLDQVLADEAALKAEVDAEKAKLDKDLA